MLSETNVVEFQNIPKCIPNKVDEIRKYQLLRILFPSKAQKALQSYENSSVLRELSFSVRAGEKVSIFSESPETRNAIIKLVVGLMEPTSGKISVSGMARLFRAKGIGQKPFVPLKRHIRVQCSYLGAKPDTIPELVEKIVEVAQAREHLNTKLIDLDANLLSKVEQLTMLLVPADVFVFEVPLAEELKQIFEEATSGKTCIFVPKAFSKVDPALRCLLVHNGKLVCDGDYNSVRQALAMIESSDLQTSVQMGFQSVKIDANEEDHEESEEVTEQFSQTGPEADSKPLAISERSGTGAVRVTGVRLLNSNKEEVDQISIGSDVYIDVDYEVMNSEIKYSPITMVCIVFENEEGRRVLGTPSEVLGKSFEIKSLKGTFRCFIPRFPVLPGVYNLAIAVLVEWVLSDKVNQSITVKVVPGQFYPTKQLPLARWGDVCVDFSWSQIES